VAITFIFNIILMLQNAKNAAIMRVLGGSKGRSRVVLWLEPISVNFCGLIIGFLIVSVLGWGSGLSSTLVLIGLFFIGSMVGSLMGVVLITNRAPLDLLQVKE
jgi:hypothetical protein